MLYPVIITFALVVGVHLRRLLVLRRARGGGRADGAPPADEGGARKGHHPDVASLVITDEPLSRIPALDKALRTFASSSEPARELINKAGVSINVGTLLLACGVAGIGAFLLFWRLSGTVVLAVPLGAVAAALAPIRAERAGQPAGRTIRRAVS